MINVNAKKHCTCGFNKFDLHFFGLQNNVPIMEAFKLL